jgi:WhiB family transcriptional regulator, redox-sensing transcriptional regulator
LGELISRPAWVDQGACRGSATRVFFFERGDSSTAARDVCKGCPVDMEFLAYALEDPELAGVWGATTERERKSMRRQVA